MLIAISVLFIIAAIHMHISSGASCTLTGVTLEGLGKEAGRGGGGGGANRKEGAAVLEQLMSVQQC
jgi:hypothetical protein